MKSPPLLGPRTFPRAGSDVGPVLRGPFVARAGAVRPKADVRSSNAKRWSECSSISVSLVVDSVAGPNGKPAYQ